MMSSITESPARKPYEIFSPTPITTGESLPDTWFWPERALTTIRITWDMADNLLPPLMAATPHGLFASDNRFADVEGDDGVPEMAIGRLPVVTSDELDAVHR